MAVKCIECILLICTISSAVAGVPASRESIEVCDMSIDETINLPRSTRSTDTNLMAELKAIATAAQFFSPLFVVGAVGYVAFAGLSMFIPSTLDKLNLPRLDINHGETPNTKIFIAGFEGIGGELVKGLISRTEVGEAAKETGRNILINSANIFKVITQFLRDQISGLGENLDRLMKVFSTGCVKNYICQVGQFTGINFPSTGSLLRKPGNRTLDDFTQAFIDGITTRDCLQQCNMP